MSALLCLLLTSLPLEVMPTAPVNFSNQNQSFSKVARNNLDTETNVVAIITRVMQALHMCSSVTKMSQRSQEVEHFLKFKQVVRPKKLNYVYNIMREQLIKMM